MSSTDVTDPRHAAARRHLQSGAIGPARQLFDALLDDTDLLRNPALENAQDVDQTSAELRSYHIGEIRLQHRVWYRS